MGRVCPAGAAFCSSIPRECAELGWFSQRLKFSVGQGFGPGNRRISAGNKSTSLPSSPRAELGLQREKKNKTNQNRAKGTKGNLSQISFLACLSCVGSGAEPLVPHSLSLASFPGRFCAIAMCWRVLLLQPIPSTPRQVCSYRWV